MQLQISLTESLKVPMG